jgi:hypothetical protein
MSAVCYLMSAGAAEGNNWRLEVILRWDHVQRAAEKKQRGSGVGGYIGPGTST